jgi:HAMP domain-containing protein
MFKTAAAFVLAFIAVLLLPIAMWVSAAISAFLNADTYKNGLAEQNIYADIAVDILPLFARQIPDTETNQFAQIYGALPPNIREQVTDEILPPDGLQVQVEHGLDIFFNWLNGTAAALDDPLDLSALQERLRGEEGRRAVDLIISSSPPCTSEQLRQIQALTPQSEIPVCQATGPALDDLRAAMIQALTNIADAIAERDFNINRVLGVNRADEVPPLPTVVEATRQLFVVGYLCPLALLSLVVALVVRSFKTFGRWAGTMAVTSAFIAILPLPIISSSTISGVTASITQSQQPPEIQLLQVRLATGLLSSGFAQFSGPVVAFALLLMLVGALLWFVPSLLARRTEPAVSVFLEDSPTITASKEKVSTASARRTGQVPKQDEP